MLDHIIHLSIHNQSNDKKSQLVGTIFYTVKQLIASPFHHYRVCVSQKRSGLKHLFSIQHKNHMVSEINIFLGHYSTYGTPGTHLGSPSSVAKVEKGGDDKEDDK